jgi:hypothetical protein
MRHVRNQSRTAAGLHVCPECKSRLVQPTRWEQTEERTHWRLWRRCPECGWECDGVYGEREIDNFDEELDLGTQAVADVLKALERETMQNVVESFATALQADLIGADDFKR